MKKRLLSWLLILALCLSLLPAAALAEDAPEQTEAPVVREQTEAPTVQERTRVCPGGERYRRAGDLYDHGRNASACEAYADRQFDGHDPFCETEACGQGRLPCGADTIDARRSVSE